ncbi:MAG TPA: 50S ribosomal protein L9 [Candidatus Desulfaltia sp.]|nr:50S ribosomal protein L9 [Candidatus Desulfaltia sp.]
MKIILKQDVENVGRKGDIVTVAPGYGRNYLIPRKLALKVTPSNMKMIEIEQQALKKKVEKERESYQDLIHRLNEVTLTFPRKAGEKDMIFGSVSAADIKDALDRLGFEIEKKKIGLEEPIKRLGHFTIPVKVFHDDKATLRVEVRKEEGAADEEDAGEPKD